MYSSIIQAFNKQLDLVVSKLNHLTLMVGDLFNQLEEHKELVKTNTQTAEDSAKKFAACAKGFYETRDACELLRSELSTAAGTITGATWHPELMDLQMDA